MLMDGGTVTLPSFGYFPEGKWQIENHGTRSGCNWLNRIEGDERRT